MFGGIALVGVMALVSMLDRRGWWSYPNLLASQFYGVRGVGAGPGWPTISGIAFQLMVASLAGAVFGFVFGRYGGLRRIFLLGLAWGGGVFFASEWYYRAAAPAVLVYLPRAAAMAAHMVYGACLSGIGRPGAELGVQEPVPDGAFHTQISGDIAGPNSQERTL